MWHRLQPGEAAKKYKKSKSGYDQHWDISYPKVLLILLKGGFGNEYKI